MIARLKRHIPFRFLTKQAANIALGAFLSSVGINLFLVPHHFVKGGVSGLSVFIHYLLPLPIWAWIMMINLPIFIAGLRVLGRGFLFGSFYGTLMLAFFVYLTEPLVELHFLSHPLMAALFGGVLGGVGIGITLRVNGSLGGTDIIGAMLQKKFSISIGTTSFALNGIIVLLCGVLLGADIASFAMVSIFVEAMALDKTVRGINTSKAVFIITSKPKEIADEILGKLARGVTFLKGEGAFYGNERRVLYCVVTLRQLARVKFYVQQIDPLAFMSVADVSEVVGRGFKPSPF